MVGFFKSIGATATEEIRVEDRCQQVLGGSRQWIHEYAKQNVHV